MPNPHFFSYSSVDAKDFAIRLYDILKAGMDWDDQIADGICTCESALFILTRDSVEEESECKHEWTLALSYKKPILPLLLYPDVKPPYRIENRQYIDFTHDFDIGLAALRNHLRDLTSPQGILLTMQYRLKEAQRDLRRAPDINPGTDAKIYYSAG